jgi:microcystin degradation protein MlrC
MSIFVVTDNDLELAEEVAEDLNDLAWSLRESFTEPLPDAKETTRLAMKYASEGLRPVIIADGADRIGDSTHMLKELLAQNAKNWVIPCITDPKAAEWLEKNAKVGDKVSLTVGGWYDEFSGSPVEITWIVEYMGRPEYTLAGPMGKGSKVKEGFLARINLGDNRHVVISERMRGANDSAGLSCVGLDYNELDIIVLKDRVHHRAFWDKVAKVDIRTSVPGQGPADLTQLHYNNAPPDAYPIGRRWREI